jgi:hypothetical protein
LILSYVSRSNGWAANIWTTLIKMRVPTGAAPQLPDTELRREGRAHGGCLELVPDQRVKLSFETAKVHFFDQQIQQRLDA